MHLPGVEVAAPRINTIITRPAATIDRQTLERLPLNTVGEALRLSPGVFVKSYGGLGGVQTLSLRGSSAPQSLFLLDGVRLNSAQNGIVDLGLLPLALIGEIQVLRGGAAALYGGNAIGGVVNARSRTLQAPAVFGCKLERASFNEWSVAAYGGLRRGSGQISAALSLEQGDGDFPFVFNQFGREQTFRRTNGDAQLRAATVRMSWSPQPIKTHATVFVHDSERGSPGAVVQGRIEDTEARLEDRAVLAFGGADLVRRDWRAGVVVKVRRADQTYVDPEFFGPDPDRHTFEFAEKDLGTVFHFATSLDDVNIESRMEFSHSTLDSEQLQNVEDNQARRDHSALALQADKVFKPTENDQLQIEAALRFDRYSNFDAVLSPMFALAWTHHPTGLSLRTQIADSYRPPSFNELYYINFGTVDLRPERGLSFNIGGVWTREAFDLTLDAFLLRTRDQIVAVPRSPITWSARNLGRVLSRGLELALDARPLHDNLALRLAATLTWTTDESPASLARGEQIVYVPRELLSAGLTWSDEILAAGVLFEFTGARPTLPGQREANRLQEYVLLDCFAEYSFSLQSLKFKSRMQIDNVFDAGYAVVRNYPMPGRRFTLGLSFVYR